MKRCKKIIAMMAAIVMMGVTPILVGFGPADGLAIDGRIDGEMIEKILGSAYRAGLFDSLTDEELQNLKIGQEIPVYEVQGNSVVSCEVHKYPIFLDSQVVAFVVESIEDESYTVTCSYLDVVNEAWSEGNAVAFVYDKYGAYLWNGADVILLYEYENEEMFEDRGNINSDSEILLRELSVTRPVVLGAVEIPQAMVYSEDTMYQYLTVQKITQSTGTCCWAACMESVLKTLNVSQKGQVDLAEECGWSVYDTKDIDAVYGKMTTYLSSYNLSLLGSKNTLIIFNSLVLGMPSIAGFIDTDNVSTANVKHMVVIRGIDYPAGTISLMDPKVGDYIVGSMVDTEPYDGGEERLQTFSYYSSAYGTTLKLYKYIVKS